MTELHLELELVRRDPSEWRDSVLTNLDHMLEGARVPRMFATVVLVGLIMAVIVDVVVIVCGYIDCIELVMELI